ncbi:N-acetylmuramoyl-L-alanine amidase [Clostridium acidisoli DSM 12555]|jgi:N-acetylmuramoyl-L-alanine amidase|uniref:N-acetylmuramoyl-L-alanine amidase n=1 Tax=Clostridium acidisoli DSM 12555 TaxID=1121291 RepID=A0A1W1XZF5_9CLOT|nr:cell wall hydrolase [Clostridium acidisoli]SMC29247.1 N-acetylmuramoyl-L-alanine amidase [Clostridium acidisoli DSM 12555]
MKKFIWAVLCISFLGMLPPSISNAQVLSKNVTYNNGGSPPYVNRGSTNLYKQNSDTVEVFNHDGRAFTITNQDIDLMAKVVYKESNAEPYEGKVAVASVILNRLKNNQFPKSIDGVVKQRYAFSCVVDGRIDAAPNKSCYDAVYDALNGKDPTSSALFFYNPKTSSSTWMDTIKKYNVKPIGNHVFFVAY